MCLFQYFIKKVPAAALSTGPQLQLARFASTTCAANEKLGCQVLGI